MSFILLSLILVVGLQILLFIPAFIFKTDKLTDLSYGFSFIIVAGGAFLLNPILWPKIILLTLISIWGLRLGIYLFIRIHKMKKDKRFDGIRENFGKFLSFWLLQGISVWAISLSSLLFFGLEKVSFNFFSIIGIIAWAFGLGVETIADWQKYKFINNPSNKGQWIEEGLWYYSRHPNYFGEILHWVGIYIFTLSSLKGINIYLALISPLFISVIILFVTGLPKLEKYADNKWGEDLEYQKYKKRTSILVPWFKGK
jgi:steroid 5-alpha reductase family enzyme